MLHTELHAMHGLSSDASFSNMSPCQPSEEVVDTLTKEMENMIVEHQLRNEGPIRSLWDTAIKRRKGVEERLEKILTSDEIQAEGSGSVLRAKDGMSDNGMDLSSDTIRTHRVRLPSPPDSLVNVPSGA